MADESDIGSGVPRAGARADTTGGAGADQLDTGDGEGIAAAHAAEANQLLRALPLEEYARVVPLLAVVRLQLRDVIIEPGERIRHVYFPRTAVLSVLAVEQEGGPVEVSTVGRDGFVGVPVLLGADREPLQVIAQMEGESWRMDADDFCQLAEERPALRRLLLRYTQYLIDFLAQSAACNRLHTLEERCARWLLTTVDRLEGDSFEMTQEFLAIMLGVRRAGVSVAMGVLQGAGIVSYRRGRIRVLDRARLESSSCDCYRITRDALERLLGPEARR